MKFAYQSRNIEYAYGNNFSLHLDELDIPAGKIFGITGPNGSGKTTLLKLLSFLTIPQKGEIKYFDTKINPAKLAKLRRQVTMLFQDVFLLQRTVFQNIAYGLQLRKDTNNIEARVDQALTQVGLDPAKFSQRHFNELSGGEAKRVALASRLILQPKVLLLDEPMMNIDKQSWQQIVKVLQNLVEQGTTIIISAHDQQSLRDLAETVFQL